jgi:hypothetical protein
MFPNDDYISGLNSKTNNPEIFRAGVRYDDRGHNLVSFGRFEQDISGIGELIKWNQTLDVRNAITTTHCEYKNGLIVDSEIFCHLEHNVIAIRKRVSGNPTPEFTFRYQLGSPRRMSLRYDRDRIHYNIDEGQYESTIALWSDKLERIDDGVLRGCAKEFCVFIAFDEANIDWCENKGFDELFASHQEAWKEYWDESYIDIPDKKMQEVYYVAQYHLRLMSTKWSLAITMNNNAWSGRYFACDEYYGFRGLLSSGHMEVARRVPEFRHATLDFAKFRVSGHDKTLENGAAHYPWEALEDGREGAPDGFWQQHVLHMAHVALECSDYYRYSGDMDFLKDKGYAVIKACALYFDLMAIYRQSDGTVKLGKCTDFERLGPGRENAFMSMCSAISTCEVAAEMAELLEIDLDLATHWRELAVALRAALPHDGKKYVPYPGCEQKSISVFTGTFPYPVLLWDDSKQEAALQDYCEHEHEFGNMYRVGKGVCTWYATLKAIVYARNRTSAQAYELLEDVAHNNTGCHSEIHEIYEFHHHPWFSTAEGNYVQAINELLLQIDKKGHVRISPGVPADWQDYAFKLQGPGGRKIEVKCCNGDLTRIS